MSAYKGFNEAQKKAHKKYRESAKAIRIRTTAERRDRIKAHAENQGKIVSGFIDRAMDDTAALESTKEENK